MRGAAILLMVLVLAGAGYSQEEPGGPASKDLEEAIGQAVRLKTKGGGAFQGSLFALFPDRVELVDGEGQIIGIARRELASFEVLDPNKDAAAYFQDAAMNRLIVMPTGFGMEAGAVHVSSQEIVAVTASYGLSERFSLWGGISIPGALASFRYSAPLGRAAAISLGAFAGATWIEPVGVFLPYAICSLGHPNRNFTLGLGAPLAVSGSTSLHLAGLLAAIGGKILVSRSASIVTETWILAMSGGGAWDALDLLAVPAAVFRIAGGRLSWDLGALVPLVLSNRGGWSFGGVEGGPIVPIPIISITYRIK